MVGRRGSGLLRVMVIITIALIVGALAYGAGVAAGQAGAASGGAATPVVYAPFGFGFGFFGLLLTIVLIGLVIAAVRGPRGWGGRTGPWAAGPYWGHPADGGRDVPPMVDEMLASWHRRAHGETGGGSGPQRGADPDRP
jgi:hypothetical protein